MDGVTSIVDVTRVKISNPVLHAWEYYSVKDGFPALKYEVAISLRNKIIWVNGPYKGAVSDIEVARDRLCFAMEINERALADKGYIGSGHFYCPHRGACTPDQKRENAKHNSVRQSIERCNKRIKNFEICSRYRDRCFEFHGKCFNVVCRILNMAFCDNPL